MPAMNRIETWTAVVIVGAALAVFDVISGWTATPSISAGFAVFGLLGLALLSFAAALRAVIVDRRAIRQRAESAGQAVVGAARGVRWTSVFAIGFAVLCFANCSSGSTSGTAGSGAMSEPSRYLTFSAIGLLPLVIALLLPAILATAAQVSFRGGSSAAHRLGQAALVSVAVVGVVALLSAVVGFGAAFGTCSFGVSPGACSAGVASLANVLSIVELGLFLPYLTLLEWALGPRAQAESSPVR